MISLGLNYDHHKPKNRTFYLELGQLTSEVFVHLCLLLNLYRQTLRWWRVSLRRFIPRLVLSKEINTTFLHKLFVQDESQINHFQGNVVRSYERILTKYVETPAFGWIIFEPFQKMASNCRPHNPSRFTNCVFFADHKAAESRQEGVSSRRFWS